jgi:uncharacterized protein DUF5947
MAAGTQSPETSRLQRLARRSAGGREAALEHCEMCSAPIAPEHRHLLDVDARELLCVCRACSILFDRPAAAEGHRRLVPDRRLLLEGFALTDVAWEELRLPVDIAFFFHSTPEQRVMAYYPGPMGATESQLRFEAWRALEAANPVLASLEPDVEALLVDRALGARRQWIVPIDECFRLVGVIRTHWTGLTGGKDVWQEIGRFFDGLDRRSRPAGPGDGRAAEAARSRAAEGS